MTSFNYRTPRPAGKVAGAILGDWTIAGLLRYASGKTFVGIRAEFFNVFNRTNLRMPTDFNNNPLSTRTFNSRGGQLVTGSADYCIGGLVTRISYSPDPNWEASLPATATTRYVLGPSGSVTLVVDRHAPAVVPGHSMLSCEPWTPFYCLWDPTIS